MAETSTAVRDAVEIGAAATATTCAIVLALALIAEVVRRRHADAPVVRLADRLLPTPGRRVAVAVLALASTVATVAGPRAAAATDAGAWLRAGDPTAEAPARADGADPDATGPDATGPDSLRDWLGAGTDPRPPRHEDRTAVDDEMRTPAAPGPAPRVVRDPGAPGGTSTVSAAPSAIPPHPSTPSAYVTSPSGGAPASAPTPATVAATATATATYTVVPGDCLWSIAARLLGSGATDRAVDRAWRAIYAANRSAVGDDPGLIHPGLLLTIPALDPTP